MSDHKFSFLPKVAANMSSMIEDRSSNPLAVLLDNELLLTVDFWEVHHC